MSLLSNIRRITRLTQPQKQADPYAGFVAWPYIDTLFDFTRVIGADKTLTTKPISGTADAQRVAIIGAGAGGLCAAFELLKCGVVADVFEASDRVGGRAWSKHFTNADGSQAKAFAEMGSMRVPPSQKTFWAYAKQFNLHSGGSFPDPGVVPTRLYYEDQSLNWQPGQTPPAPFDHIAKDFNAWITLLEGKLYPDFIAWQQSPTPQNEANLVKAWQTHFVDPFKGTSFYTAVANAMPNWSSADMNAFGALGVGSGGFGPLYPINMLELSRIILLQWEDDQQMIPFGMQAIPLAFYQTAVDVPGMGKKSLQDLNAVQFNQRVSNINHTPQTNTTTLTFEDGKQLTYNAVIVATTTRSMSYMGLALPSNPEQPAVDEPSATAIRNLHLTSSSKLFIRTQNKFWLDAQGKSKPNFPQTILTDGLPRAAYALDYPDVENGVVLISYTWEDDSIKLQALPVAERFQILRAMLYEMAPEWKTYLEPMNGEILNVDWQNEQDYYGAFKLDFPGQEPDVHASYFQFKDVLDKTHDTGVYLAGDSNSWSGGWTEGALHTGLNAATAVAYRLGGELQSYNALMQNENLYDYNKTTHTHQTSSADQSEYRRAS